jgi:hypothetical protein
LSNHTISFKVFLAWFLAMEPHLECKQMQRKELDEELEVAEKEYEDKNKTSLTVSFASNTQKITKTHKHKVSQVMSLISGGGTK